MFVIGAAVPAAGGGMDLYLAEVSAPDQLLPRRTLTEDQLRAVRVVTEDGAASASAVLAALWGEWILCSARAAPSTALTSVPLAPYPHQMVAVYEQMLPQPPLRFLLADEPGASHPQVDQPHTARAPRPPA